MRRFLFAVGAFSPISSPLLAEDDKTVQSAIADVKTQIANLEDLITKKRATLDKVATTARATEVEQRKHWPAARARIQAVKAGMEIALGAMQATEKTREAAVAQLKELVMATDNAAQPAISQQAKARNELDQLYDELGRAERNLQKAKDRLNSILKK